MWPRQIHDLGKHFDLMVDLENGLKRLEDKEERRLQDVFKYSSSRRMFAGI